MYFTNLMHILPSPCWMYCTVVTNKMIIMYCFSWPLQWTKFTANKGARRERSRPFHLDTCIWVVARTPSACRVPKPVQTSWDAFEKYFNIIKLLSLLYILYEYKLFIQTMATMKQVDKNAYCFHLKRI